MASRSLNKVQLIGNLTRDPELRYTPNGAAVCTLGLATNRYWTTDAGERKDEVEFHRLVAWNKLAELCSQLLAKGRKIYVEGRLQTRQWQDQSGGQRSTTEIVIEDMIILDPKRTVEMSDEVHATDVQTDTGITKNVPKPSVSKPKEKKDEEVVEETKEKSHTKETKSESKDTAKKESATETVDPNDIPF
jgi:single-strand DNA-binding protein